MDDSAGIFTFYSFKGGVGRSMALANVAEYFRQKGVNVIIIDWDLEAPGLENFFFEQPEKIESIRLGTGLVDMLLNYKRDFPQLAALREKISASNVPADPEAQRWGNLLDEHLPPIKTFLHAVGPIPQENPDTQNNGFGNLWLLASGWRAGERFAGYARDVQDFNWAELYSSFQGAEFFEWMRRQLLSLADIVLIDSRTGLTEMGSVCTRQLADVVVSLCTPNLKTVRTMIEVTKSFRPENRDQEYSAMRRQRPLRTVIIPTRLETSEKDLRNAFEKDFQKNSEQFLPPEFINRKVEFWNLGIPYISAYTYQEAVTIGVAGRNKELEQAYKKLAIHLAVLFPDGSRVRQCLSEDLKREFSGLQPRVYIAEADSADVISTELRQKLANDGILAWEPPQVEASVRFASATRSLVQQSEFVVMVLTPGVFKSPWVMNEAGFARRQGIKVLAILPENHSRETVLEGAPGWVSNLELFELPADWDKLTRILRQTPKQQLRVPAMALPPAENWIDRVQLRAQITSALFDTGTLNPPRVILSGPAGSGKTALARFVCNSLAIEDQFIDGILWADLTPRISEEQSANPPEHREPPKQEKPAPQAGEELTKIYVSLTGERPPINSNESPSGKGDGSRSIAEIQSVASELSSRLAGLRCLLVIDGIEDTIWLKPFLDAGRSCAMLLLTQKRDLSLDFPAIRIELPDVTPEEASNILAPFVPPNQRNVALLRSIAQSVQPTPQALFEAGEKLRIRLITGSGSLQEAAAIFRQSHFQQSAVGNDLATLAPEDYQALRALLDPSCALEMTLAQVKGIWLLGVSVDPSPKILQLINFVNFEPTRGILSVQQRVRDYFKVSSIEDELSRLAPRDREALTALATPGLPHQLSFQKVSEIWRLQTPEDRSVLIKRLLSYLQIDTEQESLQVKEQVRAVLAGKQSDDPAPLAAESSPFDGGSDAVEEAAVVLRGGKADIPKLLLLAARLKQNNEFAYARRLLARARTQIDSGTPGALRLKLIQQHALCTYKDPDLPLADRLDRALEILSEIGPLELDAKGETLDQESLGIAGAIHKRKWEADGQSRHLERSLGYYLRGYRHAKGLSGDFGYTGINAAFILDCLAAQEEASRGSSEVVKERRKEAGNIREDIVRHLPVLLQTKGNEWLGREWWFHVTVAEAAFGRRDYDEANLWLGKAKQVPVQDWEFETTARQLAAVARMQNADDDSFQSPAWKTILRFLGSETAAESKFIGKVGLALSGGGFRASLFHIGVLARLAELDLLRSVEIISGVSGGSIIGAHYYLELRRLLQEKEDKDITRDDYSAIVQRLAEDFLSGVQRNIRTQVAAEWHTNVRMMFDPTYSRTCRVGELYEKELFAKVPDGEGKKPRFLNELMIRPKGAPSSFKPKYDNWRRRAKVPILILNATTLNTGHNWQFTASFMGESPYAIDPLVDGNDRLRRMYYSEAPGSHKRIRLGYAVAASACVPGLFEPFELAQLYPEMTVRLVDGGVHDNQGIAGLLEQDANFLIVSDASGQMGVEKEPSNGLMGVPLRSNGILQSRVREAQFRDLRDRRRAGLLRSLLFIHLKKDLEVDPVDWEGCPDPWNASEEARPPSRRGLLTTYSVRKDIQERLASLRTDLDSFNDSEAFALMTSGYRMIEREFADSGVNLHRPAAEPQLWEFLAAEKYLNLSKGYEDGGRALMEILQAGEQSAFKIWRLYRPLSFLAGAFALVGLSAILLACWQWKDVPLLTPGWVGIAIISLIAGVIFGKAVVRAVSFRSQIKRIAFALALCTVGCLAANIHLWIFDPLFLEVGKLANLKKRGQKP